MYSRLPMRSRLTEVLICLALAILPPIVFAADKKSGHILLMGVGKVEVVDNHILQAGNSSLNKWVLPPATLPNIAEEKIGTLTELGRKLFFDRRLSANGNRSCATCHQPDLGWSDGLPTALDLNGEPLARATPGLINVGYGSIFTWDGRSSSLEEQAMMPVFDAHEMGNNPEALFSRLGDDAFYRRTFAALFPGQAIDGSLVGLAIAAFEMTLVANNTRFDQWIDGNAKALSSSEVRGFGIFLDSERANCASCHHAPNFTDEGFHNLGLRSITKKNPDLGRYNIRPVKLMRGAFKTPSLRNVALTAPYFHDGSAQSLDKVVEHYIQGGEIKDNLSPEMKQLDLDEREKSDLIAFLNALTEQPSDSQIRSSNLTTD